MVLSHAFFRIAVALIVLTCTGICEDQARLVIRQEPDSIGKYPESKLYIGVLVNEGAASLPLKAIQLPGGYVGSGTFFNCSVEEWNARKKSWVDVRTTDIKGVQQSSDRSAFDDTSRGEGGLPTDASS